jgi:hypothetical protein
MAQAVDAAQHRDRRRRGAFPPLVGWAAVTGRIDLTAVYLFLIIFYWTPPHFWALALLKQRDYGKAGVPMAPLVWGEAETKRQMLWYTLILLPLTLLPVAFGRSVGCTSPGARGGLRGRASRTGAVAGAVEQGRVEGLQVLPALPRTAVRGDGDRPESLKNTGNWLLELVNGCNTLGMPLYHEMSIPGVFITSNQSQ